MRLPRIRRGRGEGERTHLGIMVLVLLGVGVLAAAGSGLDDPEAPGAPAPRGRQPAGPTLRMAWAQAPTSLDPAFATDHTAANLVWNLSDPLVRLDPQRRPLPSLARRWEFASDGRHVRFFLRKDGRWTNGEAVTAHDFEFAWKRMLSPDVDSPFAPQLFGLIGASAYNRCEDDCEALAEKVGVQAEGNWVLDVTLRAREPWFPAALASPAFLAVPRSIATRVPDGWSDPETIVTNGPFRLARLTDTGFSLVRNGRWRGRRHVVLGGVEARFLADPAVREQAFDEGDVQALDGGPLSAADLPALRERREYQAYPSLETAAYAFNLRTIPDPHQRRAMALAVDRRALIENVTRGDEYPAIRVTPPGVLGAADLPASPWLHVGGDLAGARAELAQAAAVKRRLTLLRVDEPGTRAVAFALRDAWRALGIQTTVRSSPPDEFLDFEGPLSLNSVDVYQADVEASAPDAWPALELWTCGSEWNKSNFCNRRYDRFIEAAQREPDPAVRAGLYGAAEEVLSGDEGGMPAVPLYSPTYANLESLGVRDTFRIDPLGLVNLAAVDPE